MSRRPGWPLVPAGAAALLLNVVLFAVAAMLARERTLPPAEPAPVPVTLISVRQPATPEPETEPEPPSRTETPPPPDFTPDVAIPGPGRPTVADIKVALDPGALGGKVGRGDFVFDSQDLDEAPRAIVRTEPEYPFRARQRGVEGFVEVKLLVKADGSVGSVQVLESDPPDLFDSAALKAVPQWRFEPGRLDGKPVASWVRTRVVFTFN